TAVGEARTLPRTVELPGEVRMDPGAGGRVQSALGGRLGAPAGGRLPIVGQSVRAGQVLALVQTVATPVEAANQAAREAELRAQRVQAVQHLERMRTLSDSVPQKELDAAQATLAGIDGQLAALRGQTSVREPLVAPISGVVSAGSAVAGQIVEPRDVLFEIVDPSRLLVEARAFDPALAADVASASLAVGDTRIPLEFAGAARTLREQALPLVFRARGADLSRLAVGLPVKVQVQTRRRIDGVPVSTSALAKNPANETIVWVKVAPERFEPRPVRVEPLDGASVAVVAGVRAGERVVVQGASLLNQIR
ncbi:MAG: HlyD family efflux transporter periplasmic adaptor subunit, partial [Burkholderiales bacterium]